MRARVAAIVLGIVAAVALLPIAGASVIDGDEEEWIKTTIGWAYRVPWDAVPWFPLALPIARD
jgi:hypothetical protein